MYRRMCGEAHALVEQSSALIARQTNKIKELNAEIAAKQTRVVELETRLHDLLKNPRP